MSGREKLDLLAENLLEESKKSPPNPFHLEKCLTIVESQSDAYVDDIRKLRDPEFFRRAIEAELRARTRDSEGSDNPSDVAKVVATRVHNSFMLASAWKIVSGFLKDLATDGLTDENIQETLQSDSNLRDRYLVLYDMVNVLVKMSQDRSSTFETIITPLEKTRRVEVLDEMWKQIDDLLSEAFDQSLQWSAYEESSEDSTHPGFKSKNSKKPLAITQGDVSDSDDSMPELQSVSGTSYDDDDSGDSDSDEESEDSGYNDEDEEEMYALHRQAVAVAGEADYYNTNGPAKVDPLSNCEGNPYLKLLGSLRGRMFTSSPKLKTTTRTEPRGAFRTTPRGIPKDVPKTMPPKAASTSVAPKSTPASTQTADTPKSQRATVEDVEDEDDAAVTAVKKSKKKKNTPVSDIPPTPPSPTADSSSSLKKTPPAVSQASSAKSAVSKAAPGYMSSTTSLPVGDVPIAQSGHSYLRSVEVKPDKKLKERSDQASIFSDHVEPKKPSLASKLSGTKDGDKPMDPKISKHCWFANLSKKTTVYLHQLLKTKEDEKEGQASMKWGRFLKIMREIWFKYVPSTAGSSVWFDPPSKTVRSISFHKPHPDTTIHQIKLREYATKLKEFYGWNEDDLVKESSRVLPSP